MRDNKNIQDMNEKELRAYKRAYRERKRLQKKCCFISFIVVLIVIVSISISSISSAHSEENHPKFKYYKQVEIQKNDTLWEIARANIDYEKYHQLNDYIEEVKSINHLEDDRLNQGQYIIIPYYSSLYYQNRLKCLI